MNDEDKKSSGPPKLLDKVPSLKNLTRDRQHFVLEKASGKTNKAAAEAAYPNMNPTSCEKYGSMLTKQPNVQQALHEIMVAQHPDMDGAIATALYNIITNSSGTEKSGDIINASKTVISTRPGGLAPKETRTRSVRLNLPGRASKNVSPSGEGDE